jgi:hypothetical protein
MGLDDPNVAQAIRQVGPIPRPPLRVTSLHVGSLVLRQRLPREGSVDEGLVDATCRRLQHEVLQLGQPHHALRSRQARQKLCGQGAVLHEAELLRPARAAFSLQHRERDARHALRRRDRLPVQRLPVSQSESE